MSNPTTQKTRERLLTGWAQYLVKAAAQGAFGNRVIGVTRIRAIPGPRAGVLEIYAGLETGRLLRALGRDDSAALRQFVPWAFTGQPMTYMSGRALRLEVGWPAGLATTLIRLGDLSPHPRDNGRWVVGQNEHGATVIAGLNDRTAHYLVSGTTGSGKSVTVRGAVLQLSHDPANQFVLLDGKYGESLNAVAHLNGVVGPVAVDGPEMRAALGWACAQMRHRYTSGERPGRLIVVFDEFQEVAEDAVIVDLMRKIAAQGRGAGVHLIAATQHPTVDAFGEKSTRRNLTGKLALKVEDPDASRVAVGGRLPRADFLLGAGDSYAVGPGSVQRVQAAYVDERDISRETNGNQWIFDEWGDYDAGNIGQDLLAKWSYTGDELAHALMNAIEGTGRPTLINRLNDAGLDRPGSEKAARLLQLGRETYAALVELDSGLPACLGASHTHPED